MTTATDLWDEVVDAYDEDGLVALTNIRDRGATTILTATGVKAAQAVIDMWPSYAEAEFDPTIPLHVVTAVRAVIAVLWSRGGTAATIAKVEWDEVFGDSGTIAKVRRTGARGRSVPRTNSGLQSSPQTINGQLVRPWSDVDSLPPFLPTRRTAAGDY